MTGTTQGGQQDQNRRQFLVTKLATGFALAVEPIAAGTITTDTEGIRAGETKVPSGDVAIPAYEARPDKDGKSAVVLVVEEIFGVHEHIKDICRRLAKRGYYAIAPELFARQGDPSKISEIQTIVRDVVSKTPDHQVMSDLDATVAYAEKSGKGDTSRLGITGFCWGGRIVWLYSAHQPKLKAAGAWYGRLVGPADPLHPKQPIEIASEVKAAVIGFYGGKDQGIPVATVDQMRAALKAAGKDCELNVYPDAGHGFNADYRPSYNEAAAKDAWAKLMAWFEKHGVA
jgi:carboxymethylenebutenolidase